MMSKYSKIIISNNNVYNIYNLKKLNSTKELLFTNEYEVTS